MHDAVHLTGEPGENGKGWGTTLGTGKKCLTPVSGRAHGVPRQAARSGSSTGQEAHGDPHQLAGKGHRGWVRSEGRHRWTGGFGSWTRRPRATGSDSGSGSPNWRRGLRVTAAGMRPSRSLGTEAFGPRGKRTSTAGSSAPGPSGHGARGSARRSLGTEAFGSRSERTGTAGTRHRAFGHGSRGSGTRRSAGAAASGPRRPKTGGARCRRSAPGRRRRQLATVGPEELARETPSVTRGHHRFRAHTARRGARTRRAPVAQLPRASADREP